LRDGDGLWLHKSTTGKRYWVFIYIRHTRRREMGLGPLDAVTLAMAREKAAAARVCLQRGGDPLAEREAAAAAARAAWTHGKTFGEVADAFIEDAVRAGRWRGAKTEAGWRNTLSVHAAPIRKVPVGEITTDDVLKILRPIWNEKHETATKVRERVAMVLDAAKVQGLRTGDNPAEWRGHLEHSLSAPDGTKRGHHAAMPYDQVPSFIIALREVAGVGSAALEFAILSASRTGEVRGALWQEIDLEKRLWSIPAERMKSAKPHRVPLSDRSLEILKAMQKIRLGDFVFGGARVGSPISNMTKTKALRAAGAGAYTVHGFRSSFRDWVAEETNHQREVAEAALAHTVGDAAERAYRRGDALEKRRALMADWAAYCSGTALH
ncbi:MAG: tyrosine-type recombinase/integrase, partial [Thermomicrobiales bacterium]